MNTKLSKRGILTAVQVIVVAWICTGCIVVERYPYSSLEVYRQGNDQPAIWVDVLWVRRQRGIPLLLEYYVDRVPHDAELKYWTSTVVPNPSLRFDEVILRYQDGTETNLTPRLPAELVLHQGEWKVGDKAGDHRQPPFLWSSVVVEGCLPKRTPFTMRIKGQLSSNGDFVEGFDAQFDFEMRYTTRVMHKIRWWAEQGI